ncbi:MULTISPECIES: ArnT family glycosyltransferase [Pseudomonas]|uniref:Glycosyltransferase family 39 protein n=1 Tax=Pseudomonas quebecensis TaxID=2995174 RepID=A0ABY6QQG6_9PSED|nr:MULTISPECIES: glycosyltransferase family 39 protein [Pseudomonas]MCP1511176.1 4-amino-4-deoxy-L-arabinose transferase-like glycosyltransferase [Pseudomonas rhodesiae]MCX4067435.1 glycosyltransferase family 39 protein [Pseudomonas quebecensis]MDF9769996.1 4-amino-4-deoxy-L-arabinose transferase-like glycosyltransferase [Pseudomonas rhodesiae]UZW20983.1 glycosyltransferase family 39 protein [Pseudomonas quebecensis]UZW21600.1 glycosyltransferase family 39 protein [Pseudomonas quebecensis]
MNKTRSPLLNATVRRQSLVLGLLGLLLFIAGNWNQAIIGFDSRFVVFAQEMLRHGPSFFPTTYGQPYADYLATSTLLTWLLSLPLGHVSSFTAWLPTAMASALIVTLIYRLTAPYSQRWGLLSVALLLLSSTFISETRAVSLDQMLAAVTLAVFYLGYAHDHFDAGKRLHWVYLLLIVGFAVRGPIGLVVPTGVLCSYYLINRQWRQLFSFGFLALALLVACVGLLLLLAKLSGGETFMQDVIRMQFLGRMDGSEGSSGALYYFSSSLGNYALAYPMAWLVLLAVALGGRQTPQPGLKLVGYCAAAALLVLLGLSIPQAKKARYVLPMLPMAAIIAAYPFYVTQGRAFAWLRGFMLGLWTLLPVLLIAGLVFMRARYPEPLGHLMPIISLLAALQVLAVLGLLKARLRATGPALTAVLAVWATYILVVEPLERSLYDTRTFTLQVHEQVMQARAPVVLHGLGKDAKAIKYMVNLDCDQVPLFTQQASDLAPLQGPAWLVMSQADFEGLQDPRFRGLTPTLTGEFDRNPYVLLHLSKPSAL